MTYCGARLLARTRRAEHSSTDIRDARASCRHRTAPPSPPHLLICYLLDVNALFVGDGTRCAAAVRVRHARRGHTGEQLLTYVARYRTFKQPEMSSSVPDHFEARHKRTVLFKRTDFVSASLVRSLSRQQRSPPVIRNARSLQLTPALQDVG